MTNIVPGSKLWFKVSAINYNGEGAISSELKVDACIPPSEFDAPELV